MRAKDTSAKKDTHPFHSLRSLTFTVFSSSVARKMDLTPYFAAMGSTAAFMYALRGSHRRFFESSCPPPPPQGRGRHRAGHVWKGRQTAMSSTAS